MIGIMGEFAIQISGGMNFYLFMVVLGIVLAVIGILNIFKYKNLNNFDTIWLTIALLVMAEEIDTSFGNWAMVGIAAAVCIVVGVIPGVYSLITKSHSYVVRKLNPELMGVIDTKIKDYIAANALAENAIVFKANGHNVDESSFTAKIFALMPTIGYLKFNGIVYPGKFGDLKKDISATLRAQGKNNIASYIWDAVLIVGALALVILGILLLLGVIGPAAAV